MTDRISAALYRDVAAGRISLAQALAGSGSPPTLKLTAAELREAEAQFQRRLVAQAAERGWQAMHVYDPRKSRPGWPDLALWHPYLDAPMHLRELKVPPNGLEPAQRETLEGLEHASRRGFTVGVWTPHDWPAIRETLDLDRRMR